MCKDVIRKEEQEKEAKESWGYEKKEREGEEAVRMRRVIARK